MLLINGKKTSKRGTGAPKSEKMKNRQFFRWGTIKNHMKSLFVHKKLVPFDMLVNKNGKNNYPVWYNCFVDQHVIRYTYHKKCENCIFLLGNNKNNFRQFLLIITTKNTYKKLLHFLIFADKQKNKKLQVNYLLNTYQLLVKKHRGTGAPKLDFHKSFCWGTIIQCRMYHSTYWLTKTSPWCF
jgi:hypothetical protein